ncbi:hypothetical protein PAPYR_5742 [Paratrimastix pyriformis]|uniref:F-box domain-containing protein n=1 Tax=Paratrimastix pyriformis TaxID=342808 RepID=A0ABQ8UJF2_9EUKA|nr:hypothetical protein PAPYR_5742 [Paratrimastix pyriformis]
MATAAQKKAQQKHTRFSEVPQVTSFLNLPLDVVRLIFAHLFDLDDVIRMSSVCHKWRMVSREFLVACASRMRKNVALVTWVVRHLDNRQSDFFSPPFFLQGFPWALYLRLGRPSPSSVGVFLCPQQTPLEVRHCLVLRPPMPFKLRVLDPEPFQHCARLLGHLIRTAVEPCPQPGHSPEEDIERHMAEVCRSASVAPSGAAAAVGEIVKTVADLHYPSLRESGWATQAIEKADGLGWDGFITRADLRDPLIIQVEMRPLQGVEMSTKLCSTVVTFDEFSRNTGMRVSIPFRLLGNTWMVQLEPSGHSPLPNGEVSASPTALPVSSSPDTAAPPEGKQPTSDYIALYLRALPHSRQGDGGPAHSRNCPFEIPNIWFSMELLNPRTQETAGRAECRRPRTFTAEMHWGFPRFFPRAELFSKGFVDIDGADVLCIKVQIGQTHVTY